MTTLQLAQMLAGSTRHRDFATMPADDTLELVNCINQGLMEWHRLAPQWMKRAAPLAFNLPAPAQIEVSCTADSATIAFVTAFPSGGFASAAALIGCTFVYGSYRFRLTSETTFNFPWNGATGSFTFTAYADAVQISDTLGSIERVRLLESGKETTLDPISEDAAAYISETSFTGQPAYYCGVPATTMAAGAASAASSGFWEDENYLYTPTGGKIPIVRP